MRGFRAFLVGVFAVMVLAACLPGCAVLERLDDNPVLVRIAVTQGVLRYIESGDGEAEIAERKQDVVAVMTQTLSLIDSGENIGVATVFDYFIDAIDLDGMTAADRHLAMETLSFVQLALNDRIRSGELPGETMLALRGVVQSAIDAARYL